MERRLLGDRGGRRHPALLPPYSPDFNPIEMLFAKLKAFLRSAAERTIASLGTQLAACRTTSPPDECSRYLAHYGYGSA